MQTVDGPLPPLASICSLPINTSKDIPNRCRQEWAKVFCECLSSAVRENTIEAWTLLAMLPKCVLPAPHRGGNRAKLSYASHVRKCLARWTRNEFLSLWNEAKSSLQSKKRTAQAQSPEDEEKKAALRAERLVRDRELSRAMTALTSAPLAPDDDDTYAKLQAKHPARLAASSTTLNSTPEVDVKPLKATEEEVAAALKTFHRGSSGGAFGLRPEHLQASLEYHNDAYTDPLGTDKIHEPHACGTHATRSPVLLCRRPPMRFEERGPRRAPNSRRRDASPPGEQSRLFLRQNKST